MEGKGRLIPVVSGIGNFFLIFMADMALRCASINEQQLLLIFLVSMAIRCVPFVVKKCALESSAAGLPTLHK